MDKVIPIPCSCWEAVKALKDAERGRLILAVMEYYSQGRELILCGGERYLWPEFKHGIDAYREEQETLKRARAEGGKLGGRPRKEEKTLRFSEKPQGFEPPSSPLEPPNDPPDSSQKEKPPKGGKKKKGFSPPALEEVRAYCLERKNGIDPEDFLAYYETNGWVQGKACKPIVDWKACVRTWERSEANQQLLERSQEIQRPSAPRSLGVKVINGEEVAIFEKPGSGIGRDRIDPDR